MFAIPLWLKPLDPAKVCVVQASSFECALSYSHLQDGHLNLRGSPRELEVKCNQYKLPGANLHQDCRFCDRCSHLNCIQLSVPIVVHFTKGSASHLQPGGVHQQSHGYSKDL